MSAFRENIIDDLSDITFKTIALEEFVLGRKYNELPIAERADLRAQLTYMQGYHRVLTRRVIRSQRES